MGRPSLLLTRVRKQDGKVVSAHVGGGCVAMMEGTFRLQGRVRRDDTSSFRERRDGAARNPCADVEWIRASLRAPRNDELLDLLRRQILHLHPVALLDDLGDPSPVAMLDDRARSRAGRPGRPSSPAPTARRVLPWPAASSDVWRRSCAAASILAAARGLAAFLRRAEPAQMHIGNAALVEPGGELVLGKAGPARGRRPRARRPAASRRHARVRRAPPWPASAHSRW